MTRSERNEYFILHGEGLYKPGMIVQHDNTRKLSRIYAIQSNNLIILENLNNKLTYTVDIDTLYEYYDPYDTEMTRLLYESKKM